MALTPGGGRSPSAAPPPRPTSPGGAPRQARPRPTLQAAGISVLRWSVLIGGLVIIADLIEKLMQQRLTDATAVDELYVTDLFVNVILFSVLGAVVVRETGRFYLGAAAGVIASLLDAVVVVAASSLAPGPGDPLPVQQYFLQNVAIGTLSAGLSGIVSSLVRARPGPGPR